MSVSEHANYLLNEYGRLQFDYAAYCKPYGESLRNEARNNLETYIAELEAAQRWIPVPQSPEVQESEATSCKFCGSNKSDRRMNSIVCSSCGRKIGNVAPPDVQA